MINPFVSVIDDGFVEEGLGSALFDDEGVPTSRKYLIQDGILRGYLYNIYTAKKDGFEATGNALRGGFLTLPGVGPLNLSLSMSLLPACRAEG